MNTESIIVSLLAFIFKKLPTELHSIAARIDNSREMIDTFLRLQPQLKFLKERIEVVFSMNCESCRELRAKTDELDGQLARMYHRVDKMDTEQEERQKRTNSSIESLSDRVSGIAASLPRWPIGDKPHENG